MFIFEKTRKGKEKQPKKPKKKISCFENNKQEVSKSKLKMNSSNDASKERKNLHEYFNEGTLEVTILSGQNLYKKNASFYILIALVDQKHQYVPNSKQKLKVNKSTSTDFQFNEFFKFFTNPSHHGVLFKVIRKKSILHLNKETICQTIVPAIEILASPNLKKVLHLENRQKGDNEVRKLEVQITYKMSSQQNIQGLMEEDISKINQRFFEIFNVPSNQKVIEKHSAGILISQTPHQGTLYVTQNYFCFHTLSKKWIFRLTDIETIEKRNSPGPIEMTLHLKNGKKYIFTNLFNRDQLIDKVNRLKEATLLELNKSEIDSHSRHDTPGTEDLSENSEEVSESSSVTDYEEEDKTKDFEKDSVEILVPPQPKKDLPTSSSQSKLSNQDSANLFLSPSGNHLPAPPNLTKRDVTQVSTPNGNNNATNNNNGSSLSLRGGRPKSINLPDRRSVQNINLPRATSSGQVSSTPSSNLGDSSNNQQNNVPSSNKSSPSVTPNPNTVRPSTPQSPALSNLEREIQKLDASIEASVNSKQDHNPSLVKQIVRSFCLFMVTFVPIQLFLTSQSNLFSSAVFSAILGFFLVILQPLQTSIWICSSLFKRIGLHPDSYFTLLFPRFLSGFVVALLYFITVELTPHFGVSFETGLLGSILPTLVLNIMGDN